VKILDFGLVKIVSKSRLRNAPDTSVIAGTPDYMAPELLVGGGPSQASDVWAVGVIAYEMLTGELPFVRTPAADWQRTCLMGSSRHYSIVCRILPGICNHSLNASFSGTRSNESVQRKFSIPSWNP
jgi:serine/threonine protein kinase